MNAYDLNAALEFQRNRERYAFLKWGQTAFRNFSAVPPGMGICHQVNLEYLARVVFTTAPDADGKVTAYPDTLVGTDSHTTMVNGLGVLGWGVGGIEAEAAMLGQPVSMLVPQVVGFSLTGKLKEGTTATDLVLTVTEALRKLGVVGKFVEFYGPGVSELPLADRATIANMAPEYGATCGIFPVDDETLKLPPPHRPQRRAHRALRGLLPRARPVPHARRARSRVLRNSVTRSLHRRAQRSRPQAPAGPRAALQDPRELRANNSPTCSAPTPTSTPSARWCAGKAKAATHPQRRRDQRLARQRSQCRSVL